MSAQSSGDIHRQVSSSIVGNNSKKLTDIKAGLTVDTAALNNLSNAFVKLRDKVKSVREEMSSLADEAERYARSVGTASGPARSATGVPQFSNSSPGMAGATAQAAGGGGGGGSFAGIRSMFSGGGGPGGSAALAGAAGFGVGMVLGKGVGAVDSRIDRNRLYSLGADQLSMNLQMRYNMSQNQIANTFRKPLSEYRLGADGINQLMSFEAQTGISALQQGSSIEGLRALSGYSQSTTELLSILNQNLNPGVANRQFMMMGGMGSMYGMGGRSRSWENVLQNQVRMFQLDNSSILAGARRPGSISRYRMSMAGISPEQQDILINMGQAQNTYKARGGRGRFDPSNPAHRELVGVEDNYASQAAETERLQAKREEDMYRRQADNYSDLEKSNQSLIKALGSLEDTLSGLIGVRASSRPWQRIGGLIMTGVGAGMVATGVGAGAGAAMIAGGTALATSGDPSEGGSARSGSGGSSVGKFSSSARDDQITIPVGYGGARKTLNEVKQRSDFQKMHPTMQQRLLAMFRANPNLGIGNGWRDSESQRQMFLDRYVPSGDKTGVYWNGKYWKRVKGAPAAPPGRSMHEIGLAADLVGDLDWLQSNASKFGLKTFAQVNNEPWHVQAAELPNSRREYEESGAPWGTDGDFEVDASFTESSSSEHAGGSSSGGSSTTRGFAADFTGSSIQNIVDAYLASGSFGGGGRRSRTTRQGASQDIASSASGGAMAAARAAFAAGFRGEDLATIVAIAGRESGWRSDAVNPNTSDRGMWQINWSANQSIAKSFGAKSIGDLLDVNLNAKVAYALYQSGGWRPWRGSDSSSFLGGQAGWDPNGSHLWKTDKHMAEARAAASAVSGSGDPVEHGGAPSSRPVTMASGSIGGGLVQQYHVEVAPTIQINGDVTSHNVRALAREIVNITNEQTEIAVRRAS